jgi:hypothetical protein
VATLQTKKTDTTVTLPIRPILADTLAAGPCDDLTYITNKLGRPFTKESFGNASRMLADPQASAIARRMAYAR